MKKFKVRILDTGEEFLTTEGEIIFEDYIKSGSKTITRGCFGGGCGVCKIEIISGEYQQVKKMSKAYITGNVEDRNKALLCCIIAKSDLTIKKLNN